MGASADIMRRGLTAAVVAGLVCIAAWTLGAAEARAAGGIEDSYPQDPEVGLYHGGPVYLGNTSKGEGQPLVQHIAVSTSSDGFVFERRSGDEGPIGGRGTCNDPSGQENTIVCSYRPVEGRPKDGPEVMIDLQAIGDYSPDATADVVNLSGLTDAGRVSTVSVRCSSMDTVIDSPDPKIRVYVSDDRGCSLQPSQGPDGPDTDPIQAANGGSPGFAGGGLAVALGSVALVGLARRR
jgi:hypothetical protein